MRFLNLPLVLQLLLFTSCVSPLAGLYPPPRGETPKTIYVIHRGLHTGIIVRTADIPEDIWPESKAYPHAQFLEVGWGDSEGYRFPWTTPMVLRALFHSKGSVLLVHDFKAPVAEEYNGTAKQVVAAQISTCGFDRLCHFIQSTYWLNPDGQPVPLTSAYQGEKFYEATGRYSILNNCNNWTARALRGAGCPICPRCSLLAWIVMLESRHFGQVILPR